MAAAIEGQDQAMVYRRFGYLRTRLLLYRQDVLRDIELQLDNLDNRDFQNLTTRRAICCRQGDDARTPPQRRILLARLEGELKRYGQSFQERRELD